MYSKSTLTLIFLFATVAVNAQRERVHLDVSRYSAHAGDTLFFKGTVFKGRYPSRTSTNLYVQLLSDKGAVISRQVFPINQGLSKGQVILPGSLPSSNYYLVALTRQQLNYDTSSFFSVPILVYNKVAPAIVHRQRQSKADEHWTSGTIKGITWISRLYDARNLSVLLRIDSPYVQRQLKIEQLGDSSIQSIFYDVTLGPTLGERQFFIPVDTLTGHAELLLLENEQLLGRQWITLCNKKDSVSLSAEFINTSPNGYNSWDIDLPDTGTWFTSISVTDADLSIPDPRPIDNLMTSFTEDYTAPEKLVDTAFISLPGNALTSSGKDINDRYQELVLMGVKDSNYLFTKLLPLDDHGRFRVDSLIFFGKMDLQFQLNKSAFAHPKDVQLQFKKIAPPPDVNITSIRPAWEDDHLPVPATATEGTIHHDGFHAAKTDKIKTLPTAVVRGWKDVRTELDTKYTTGPFSEPALYAYDLRNYTSDYNRDIFSYINALGTRLYYDQASGVLNDRLCHPIHIFVDEREYDPGQPGAIRAFDFDRLAYLKILESDFLSTQRVAVAKAGSGKLTGFVQPTAINVCIYTRKGTDFRTMCGGLNTVSIQGYDPILNFREDEASFFWDTYQSGHHFTVQFHNSATAKRFRLKLEGVNYEGKVIHYETIIDEKSTAWPGGAVAKRGGEQ